MLLDKTENFCLIKNDKCVCMWWLHAPQEIYQFHEIWMFESEVIFLLLICLISKKRVTLACVICCLIFFLLFIFYLIFLVFMMELCVYCSYRKFTTTTTINSLNTEKKKIEKRKKNTHSLCVSMNSLAAPLHHRYYFKKAIIFVVVATHIIATYTHKYLRFNNFYMHIKPYILIYT